MYPFRYAPCTARRLQPEARSLVVRFLQLSVWSLFRPRARKALLASGSVDDRPQIARIPNWLILAALCTPVVLIGVWFFAVRMTTEVEMRAILTTSATGGIVAEMFIPFGKMQRLRMGAPVFATPAHQAARTDLWRGTLATFAAKPLTGEQRAALPAWLQAESQAHLPLFRIRAHLQGRLPYERLPARARVILRKDTPYRLLISGEEVD